MKDTKTHNKLLNKREKLINELNAVNEELGDSFFSTPDNSDALSQALFSVLKNVEVYAFFLIDKNHKIVFVNNSLSEYLADHQHPGNIQGKSIQEAFPSFSEWMMPKYQKTFTDGKTRNEERLIQVGTKNYLIEIIYEPLKQKEETTFILTKIKDITGIQESEKHAMLLAAILDNTDDRATIKDLDLRIIGANKALVKASGRKHINEVLGKTDLELYGDNEHVRQYMEDDRAAQKLKPGEYIEREEYFVLPDGQVKDTLVRKFPIFNDAGAIIATANISRDISLLKLTTKELQKSEAKYRNLIENQGEGVCIIDNMGDFTFVNKAAELIFEVEQGKLIGQPIKDFITPKDHEIIDHQMNENLRSTKNTYEIEITTGKENNKFILITATPYVKSNENPEETLLLFRDITERRLAEKALIESEQELKELNATKDKFFSIIAHDLKNPFGSILGFSELILGKLQKMDLNKIAHYTKIIQKASKNGHELLENLLEWSRSQNGTLKYQPTRVFLRELTAHNIMVTSEIAENKQIRLIQKFPKKRLPVYCDEDMVNTVLRNLITNAIKFSSRGSEITISVGKENKSMARVEVRDKGVGISPEEQAKLFRIEASESERGTEGEEGTGLGLILCKEFVLKNKGTIWLTSEPGKGSCFIFTLPLYLESSEEHKAHKALAI